MATIYDIPTELIMTMINAIESFYQFTSTCKVFYKLRSKKEWIELMHYIDSTNIEERLLEERIGIADRSRKNKINMWILHRVKYARDELKSHPIFVAEGTRIHKALSYNQLYTEAKHHWMVKMH